MKPTILVTGATGFIGEHLARRLVREGWQVRLLVRDTTKLAADLRATTQVVVGDLANDVALKQAVSSVSVIFHCAANVKTWDTLPFYYATNVLGTQNLLHATVRYAPGLSRFVHLSTADVYGFPIHPRDETHATSVSNFGYGDSKREGEIELRKFCAANQIPYTILRPCNVIGPGSQFIQRIGDGLAFGIMLTIDKGRANAGILYIDDLVDYMLWAAQADNAVSECYNVRSHYDVSWGEFMILFRCHIKGRGLVVNLPFGVANMAARLCEIFYRLCLPSREPLLHRLVVRIFGRTCGHSAEKIRSASAVQSQIDFSEAMRRSLAWYANGNS